jgi:hypothetical protein
VTKKQHKTEGQSSKKTQDISAANFSAYATKRRK